MDKPSTAVADDIWPKLISCGLGHARDSFSATKPNPWNIMSHENIDEQSYGALLKQAVPINGDNIPPLWSVPTPSRNTQQIVLFLSHCGSYTGENLSIRSIFGHQRAKNEGTNTKIDRGPEPYPISINPRDEMNRANSFREKLRKPRFSVNFWPPEGQKWGHEHENR